jgi:hypothetical protein
MTTTIDSATKLDNPSPCPPWCDIEDHHGYDGDKMHHTLTWAVPATTYPYEVQGEPTFAHINVSRIQVGNSDPVILVEPPAMADAADTDSLITIPGQFIITASDAADLAAALLKMSDAPEKLVQQVFTYVECRGRESEYKHFGEGYTCAMECIANRLEQAIRDGESVADLIARIRMEAHEEGERTREIIIPGQ